MSAPTSAIGSPILRLVPRTRRDLRLASGLVLFSYVTLHLACHALGLVSLDVAERALRATVLLWHSPPGTLLLYGAALVHISLALLAVYDRRTLRMPPLQALRIVLGLAMPFALIGHYVATRYAFDRFGLAPEYARLVPRLWASGAQGLSLGLLAPGWLHGCLGLRYAFSHRPGWQRAQLALFAAALLLPVLAAVGFVTMGRALEARAVAASPAVVDGRDEAALRSAREGALLIYVALVAWIGVGRGWRAVAERRNRSVVWISYPERTVSVPRGWTVLEASRSFGIAHAAVCGGRARCTTCRVRVVDGASHCPPPAADEQRALDRIAAAGADIRLACQLRPSGDIAVEPLVTVAHPGPKATPQSLRAADHDAALLFVDLGIDARGAASATAAHDTVHALGRCLAIVDGAATATRATSHRHSVSCWLLVLAAGADRSAAVGRALAAAARIAADAERLRASLAAELGLQLAPALVLHVGRVVVATIGIDTTAVAGAAVDEAERMRTAVRGRAAGLTISREAAALLGVDDERWQREFAPQGNPAEGGAVAWGEAPIAALRAP